jgi:hypothetical protein
MALGPGAWGLGPGPRLPWSAIPNPIYNSGLFKDCKEPKIFWRTKVGAGLFTLVDTFHRFRKC